MTIKAILKKSRLFFSPDMIKKHASRYACVFRPAQRAGRFRCVHFQNVHTLWAHSREANKRVGMQTSCVKMGHSCLVKRNFHILIISFCLHLPSYPSWLPLAPFADACPHRLTTRVRMEIRGHELVRAIE